MMENIGGIVHMGQF